MSTPDERRLTAELAALHRELDWLRVENLHFLEKIGKQKRIQEEAYRELTLIGPGMGSSWFERADRVLRRFCVRPEPVLLPWCPECGRTGTQPGQKRRAKKSLAVTFHCLGWEAQHRKTQMEMVEYQPKGWSE